MKPDLSCIAAIAFDLDGTLVDSAPDIGHALNTALAVVVAKEVTVVAPETVAKGVTVAKVALVVLLKPGKLLQPRISVMM